MKKVKVSTTGRLAADILRNEILRHQEGDYFGSEADLIGKLGISIPTFRQAARLLEYEQLLTSKRGVGGGYFVRKPNPDAVAHLGAVVLRSHDASTPDTTEVYGRLMEMAVAKAARCKNRQMRRQFEKSVNATRLTEELSYNEYLEETIALMRAIARMSGSPVIELFICILLEFATVRSGAPIFVPMTRRVQGAALRSDLAKAILAGDEATALRDVNKMTTLMRNWWNEDLVNGRSAQFSNAERRSAEL